MRKILYSLIFLGLGLGFSNTSYGQTIDLDQPANPPILTPDVCQCDSLELQFAVNTANFSFGTDYYVEITTNTNDWTIADTLPIGEFRTNPPTSSPIDSFTIGSTKFPKIMIPCDRASGNNFFRVQADDPNLAQPVISDTIIFLVNSRPTSSIDTILHGFENPYSSANDLGFCRGDSIILTVDQVPGGFYQWTVGGIDLVGENDTMLVVRNAGIYAVKTRFGANGACVTTSEDTLISNFLPPTDLSSFTFGNNIRRLDNPLIGNFSPLDSIQFCETEVATIQFAGGLAPSPLTYRFQWLSDSITQAGTQVFFPVVGETNSSIDIDTTGGYYRFYLEVNDGLCIDTSEAYHVFVDSIPWTNIRHIPYFGQPVAASPYEACLTIEDSITLSANIPASSIPNIPFVNRTFQWQKLDIGANVWIDIPGEVSQTLVFDTSALFQPVQTLNFLRLKIQNFTIYGAPTCEYITDSMRIRYLAPYTIDYDIAPFIIPVDKDAVLDSVSMCATDSITLVAPQDPPFQFGLSYKYQWLTDSVASVNNQTILYPLVNDTLRRMQTDSAGRYYVVIDDGICRDTSDAFWVFMDSVPSTTITDTGFVAGDPSDRLLCLYDSVLIIARDIILPPAGWDYQWQGYSTLTGWIDMTGDTLPGIIVDTSIFPLDDTVSFRLLTSYVNQFGITTCSDTTDSIDVWFFDLPINSFFPGDSLGVCPNDSVLIVAQGNGLQYEWLGEGNFSSSIWIDTPGQYVVKITGINGCESFDTIDIFSQSTAVSAGSDQTIFSGQTATLMATGNNIQAYRWLADKPIEFNDFLSQTITVSKTLPDTVLADTIVITIIATGAEGCIGTDQMTLIIRNPRSDSLLNAQRTYNLFTPGSNDQLNSFWDIREITEDYGACEIQIMNRWGGLVFEDDAWIGIWDGNDSGGSPAPDGTYYYILSCDGVVILKSAVTLIRN